MCTMASGGTTKPTGGESRCLPTATGTRARLVTVVGFAALRHHLRTPPSSPPLPQPRPQYRCDLREGIGTYTWANGDSYEGKWDNGEQSGFGRYKYANGDVYEGNWQTGRKHGRGVLRDTDGNIFFEVWSTGHRQKHEDWSGKDLR